MWEAVLEALLDSLKALPILLVVYLIIELVEHKSEVKFEKTVASSKKTGPLWGAGLGCLPQCGFSAVMADLFGKKMITIGTLFAVFVATSDEAVALLLSNTDKNFVPSVLILLAFKFVLAVGIGFLLDWIFKKQTKRSNNLLHGEHDHTHQTKVLGEEDKDCDHCKHNHLHHKHELQNDKEIKKSKVIWNIFLQGLWHTLQIFVWILIANVLLAVVLQLAGGEETLMGIMGTNQWYQPFVCTLIGLIPNCAGSVALVSLYMDGIISFASCLGGLCAGAGIGLIILFKNNKNIKQNLLITLGLYGFGVVVGLLFNLFLPFAF